MSDFSSFVDTTKPTVQKVPACVHPDIILLFRREIFENWINNNSIKAVQHIGKHVFHLGVVDAYIGVSIDFDEPNSQIRVYHKVKAEKLEAVPSFRGIHRILGAQEAVNCDVFHSLNKVPANIKAVVTILLIKIRLKLLEAQSIALLMFSIIFLVFHL